MKKTVIWIFLALLSGSILGKFTFDNYEKVDVKKVISIGKSVYMLKYGTYSSLEEMEQQVGNIERYVYIKTDDSVSAYLAMAVNKDNIEKVLTIYKSKGLNLSIDKIKIDNDEFIQNLNEYEKLLSATTDDNSLLIIEKQILASYSDLVVNYE